MSALSKSTCLALVLAFSVLNRVAYAQHTRYVGGFLGQGMTILGSEDPRRGGGASIGFGYIDPKLRWGKRSGELIREYYIHYTESRGVRDEPPNKSWAGGVLFVARYRFPSPRFFAEIGWGIQLADNTSVDLDSRVNSTPMIGWGWDLDPQRSVGVRWLHVSNAGTKGQNQGMNSLLFVFQHKF